jgi:hypothetical protein
MAELESKTSDGGPESRLRYVGTEHLLIAVLGAGRPTANYLTRRGISPERLAAELRASARSGTGGL